MKLRISVIAIAVSQAFSVPVFATENNTDLTKEAEIEKITVIGDFKHESIQTLSASVSLFSEQDINIRGAVALDEILTGAANINFTAGASRGRFLQIRGVGLRSQFVDPIAPSVGLVIDGINYSGLGGAAILFDASQVEIYRGPQGTRFGADAMAGMVRVETGAANSEPSLKFKLGAGNYNSKDAGLAVGNALSDNTNFRASIYQSQSDGYVKNAYLNREDTAGRDETAGRFKINSQLTAALESQLTFHYIDIDNGYDGFTLDNSRTSVADEPGKDKQKNLAIGSKNVYSGFDFADITLNLTAINSDLLYSYDEDWVCNDATQAQLCEAGLHDWGYSTTDAYQRDRQDRSAELQFSDKNHNWVTGLYFQTRNVDLTRSFFDWNIGEQATFTSTYDTQNIAWFGQIETSLNDKTTLISGLRLEHNSGDYEDSYPISQSTSDTMLGGKLALEYQVVPRTMIYTSLTRGYKAGGINAEALAKAKDAGFTDNTFFENFTTFEPEYLWNAEFGVKGASSDDKLRLRITAFYMHRDNMQLKAWKTENQNFTGYYDNASKGKNYGLEIDSQYLLTDKLSIAANIGYLRTEIDGFFTADGKDQSGRDQAQAPKYNYSASMRFDATDNIHLNFTFEGKDQYFYSDSHDSQSENVNLVNFNIGYTNENWSLNAWARNLFDEDQTVRGFEFGNDPRDSFATHTYVQYGEPRVAGISFNYEL